MPTALKVLRGNPGQKKLNTQEPQPAPGPVVKPATLSASGGGVWDEIAPLCLAMGTLTAADVAAFETFCELKASSRRCSVGKGKANWPHAREERDAANALKSYYDFFGLTPSGRSRIKVPKAPEQAKKWAQVS